LSPPLPQTVALRTSAVAAASSADKEALLADRRQVFGYNVALNYSDDPLLIVRGEGQYLYDEVRERGRGVRGGVPLAARGHTRWRLV
jgi:hypothetical protein